MPFKVGKFDERHLHVDSIIRPLWSAGFEWELRLFATASQPA